MADRLAHSFAEVPILVFPRILALLALFALIAATTATTVSAQAAPSPTPSGCVTTPVGVHIELENPQPGDTLLSGTQVVINGIAFDTGSTSGPGISSVTVYLGARDAGGLALGTALLGQPNPKAPAGSQFSTAGFTLRTATLPSGSGGRSIFVYARSSVGNAEGVLEVPVFLNAAPTPVRGQVPTAVLPTPVACTPTPTPTTVPTATPVPPAVPAAPVAPPTSTRVTLATSTPFPTLPPITAAPPPAVPPPAAAPAPAAPAAVAPTQTTAPRGGGIPAELGLLILGVGTAVVGGGLALRRRERR
jgi:hypothetical protein